MIIFEPDYQVYVTFPKSAKNLAHRGTHVEGAAKTA